MNKLKALKASALVAAAYVMTSPAFAQTADLSADAMVGEINKAKVIMIAVAGAIFALVGIVVAVRFSRKTAGG